MANPPTNPVNPGILWQGATLYPFTGADGQAGLFDNSQTQGGICQNAERYVNENGKAYSDMEKRAFWFMHVSQLFQARFAQNLNLLTPAPALVQGGGSVVIYDGIQGLA